MDCNIRMRALKVAMYNAQMNKFGLFKGESCAGTAVAEKEEIDRGTLVKPEKPIWVKKTNRNGSYYFDGKTVKNAVRRQEKAVNDTSAFHYRKRIIIGGRPTKTDEAKYVMETVYSALLSHFEKPVVRPPWKCTIR